MISKHEVEEEKYARKFGNIPHTLDSRQGREGRQLSPCRYQQYRTITKPDSPDITLTKLTAATPQWLLVDVYVNIATSKTDSSRREFNRMLENGKANRLNIITTRSVSGFGGDTAEILEAPDQLKQLGVRMIFEQEELDTAETDSDLMITIIEFLTQAENESGCDNIEMGIKHRAAAGALKLYDRKCYGYKHDSNDKLVINEEMAENAKLIFDLYPGRQNVLGIIRELGKRKVPPPTGKKKWCERAVDAMLSNEKYTGDALLLRSGRSEVHYLVSYNNPAMVEKEAFEVMQIEREKRGDVIKDESDIKGEKRKYSTKK